MFFDCIFAVYTHSELVLSTVEKLLATEFHAADHPNRAKWTLTERLVIIKLTTNAGHV